MRLARQLMSDLQRLSPVISWSGANASPKRESFRRGQQVSRTMWCACADERRTLEEWQETASSRRERESNTGVRRKRLSIGDWKCEKFHTFRHSCQRKR